MPNGWNKNWIRLYAVIDGFRARYKAWPNRVRMSPVIIDDLINNVFDPALFAQIESKLNLVGDDAATLVAEDEGGRNYNYSNDGFTKVKPDISAQDWFCVKPNALAY